MAAGQGQAEMVGALLVAKADIEAIDGVTLLFCFKGFMVGHALRRWWNAGWGYTMPMGHCE